MSPKRTALDRDLHQFVKHAYAHSPAMRRVLEETGLKPKDIQCVADLERVPVTPKDRVIQMQQANPPFGGLLAVPIKRLKRVCLSPGPLLEPRGKEQVLDRAGARIFRAAGFKRGDIALNTLSYHLSPGGWILDGAMERAGVIVVPGGVGSTELQMRTMIDLKIRGYAGTPSFLMTILKKAEELGIDVKKEMALRVTLFTAEPYSPSLRAQFEEGYGLRTTNAYATGELGILAFECKEHAGLHLSEDLVIEVVDSSSGTRVKPGEPGEIVVTTFNETYPILRLGTGDLAAYTDQPCACGRTCFRLTELLGRVGDAIKVRGMFVHPNQLKMAMARFPAVSRMQGVITRPDVRDEWVIQAELSQAVDDCEALSRDLGQAVRELCRVGVDTIEFVPAGTLAADAKMLVDKRTWK